MPNDGSEEYEDLKYRITATLQMVLSQGRIFLENFNEKNATPYKLIFSDKFIAEGYVRTKILQETISEITIPICQEEALLFFFCLPKTLN